MRALILASALVFVLLPALARCQGTAPGTLVVNTRCPVMPQEEVDETSLTVTYEGKEVRLCCKRCRRKFLEEPERYLPALPQFAPNPLNGAAAGGTAPAAPLEAPLSGAFTAGRLHVVAVHFPIALLLFAASLEIVGFLRGRGAYGAACRPLVVAGAAAAWAAWFLGGLLAEEAAITGARAAILERHETFGLAAAAAATLAACLGELHRRGRWRSTGAAYAAALLAAAASIGFAGHLGGQLVHGADFLAF